MYVKLPPGDMNLGPYPPHLTNTYTCGVTIAPRLCGGFLENLLIPSVMFCWIACKELRSSRGTLLLNGVSSLVAQLLKEIVYNF